MERGWRQSTLGPGSQNRRQTTAPGVDHRVLVFHPALTFCYSETLVFPWLSEMLRRRQHPRTASLYAFGSGTTVTPRSTPGDGPSTTFRVDTEENAASGCRLQYMVADDEDAPFVVEIPIGAALFRNLQPDTYPDQILTTAYVEHLQRMVWRLDLGCLRI
jgi:hypothetical protein